MSQVKGHRKEAKIAERQSDDQEERPHPRFGEPGQQASSRSGVCIRDLLLRIGLVLGFAALTLTMAQGQSSSTTLVQDTIYRADGTPASGTLIVSWPGFSTAANAAIAAGSLTIPIGATGAVSFSLAPNALALPGGTYYTAVYHLSDGTVNKEYWVVPAAASVTLAEIRSQLVPATVADPSGEQAVCRRGGRVDYRKLHFCHGRNDVGAVVVEQRPDIAPAGGR